MPKYTSQQLEQRSMQNVFARTPEIDESHYGELETLDLSDGRKIAVEYGENSVNYLVPSDSAWTAGVGAIQIDRAYRILNESEGKANVRKVTGNSELESVASGYLQEIMRTLMKREQDTNKNMADLKKEKQEIITPEQQRERYDELFNSLADAERKIEEERFKSLPHVYKKAYIMKILGEIIPTYEKEVPEDVREQFGYDIKGLVEKVSEIL